MRTATFIVFAAAAVASTQAAIVPRNAETITAIEASSTPTEEITTAFTETTVTTETASSTLEETATASVEPTTTDEVTATSTEAATGTVEAAGTVPEPIHQLLGCVRSIATETCANCVSTSTVFGFTVPNVNGTCLDDCLHNDANKDVLAEKCPNLAPLMACKDTLEETCGHCSREIGDVFGMKLKDTDEDCFERCYLNNKDTIRGACPLPEPLKKAYDCHNKLAELCDECVSDEHEIDVKCLDGCYTDNVEKQPELADICPEKMVNNLAALADLMPGGGDHDLDLGDGLEGIMSNIDLPIDLDFLGDVLEDVVEAGENGQINAESIHGVISGLLGSLAAPAEPLSVSELLDVVETAVNNFFANMADKNDGREHALEQLIKDIIKGLKNKPEGSTTIAATETTESASVEATATTAEVFSATETESSTETATETETA